MTTSLGKRSSVNGISDIAYSDEKAPVYTSTNQFVQGTKTFNAPIKALNNVLCSGFYYGDGSHLTNLPIVNDPSKLPLAGGTMTGSIVMSLNPIPVVINTVTNEHIEITDTVDQIVAIGFNPGTITDPKVYLQNGVNTLQMSATNVDITGPGTGQHSLTNAGSVLYDYASSRTVNNTYNGTEYYDPNVHSGTYCRAGSSLYSNWSGFDVQTYGGSQYSASLGFYSSFGQNPILQLTTPVDNTELGASALIYTNLTSIGSYPENFKLKADTNFFKFDCGSSYRIREHDGTKVNKDDAIIVTPQSISNYDFKSYEEYLDSNGQGGFSVIIIHPGSVPDPTINCPDILMVTRDYGPQSSFNLPKWSTARFILTPTDPAIGYPNNFVWMVSW
jgi:hypothetical protein